MTTEATQKTKLYVYKPGEYHAYDELVNNKTKYSGETIDEVKINNKDNTYIVLSRDDLFKEIDKLADQEYTSKPASIIDEERYNEMLNVLPPCRFGTRNGIQFFHISERYCADIVSWFGNSCDVFIEFKAPSTISEDVLNKKFVEAAASLNLS